MAKSFDELARKTMSQAALRRADARAREILAELLLSELRQATGASQKELAARLGIKQPTLARMERQDDIQVGTLKRIVAALGGQLEITAKFPKGRVSIRPFGIRSGKRRTRGEVRDLALA
jgi:transcriptional regulator with XRE-family HTH domain